jgi:hypothetical protein
VNSVGELPLDYLSCGIEQKSKVAFANALEIAEQYRVKERMTSLNIHQCRLEDGYGDRIQAF